ncbi:MULTISPECIES: hypothetical protein [Rhodovulum]|uniref:Uncharacterized protein DUF1127 n=4 Tax=Rhodovulum TaxID=34008 RepID=A0A4R8FYA7_9RHOB|nr:MULTISPECIES: hypothetical protein [Rhodovulum]PTW51005.1 uncharacterized protein DUF1127 [Rhodovulum kholense]TDX28564.1 uncharacterized protein DUF1127 [Rhodovulum visakhapatnamense]
MATPFMTVKSVPGGMAERLDLFFAGLGLGVNPYGLRRARMREIQNLNACSDAQLAKLGITRDEIPRYVFRDLFN